MQYCEYNLQNYINFKRNAPLSIKEIKTVLTQLNNTFKIMYKEKLIHRDLKPNNILISLNNLDNNSIKLSDYGATRELCNSMTLTGTPLIMAPEVLEDGKDLSKSDLWSLGILIYYMYFREYPYNGKNDVLLLKDINSGKKLQIIENEELNDLMMKLLKINTNERLSWEEYFNHKFFKSDDKDKIRSFDFNCKQHSQNLKYYCKNFK